MKPPSSTIETGTVIAGRYRLGQLLGSGGMAFVYDGVDLRLQRLVAVKVLRPEMVVREDIRSRFEAEARAAAGFSHPNAVAVYDTGEHEGLPFLVMERLPGDTLADRMAVGPVDPVWLRRAAEGVLGALAVAHAGGIVHRDVKPGNILLAADGTAKISDFGIAKSLLGNGAADLTGTGQLLGTPAYLAPERLEGKPATVRSDLFGLGVVLYEALAGRKPFTGDSPVAVARAVSEGTHVPLQVIRPDLDPAFVAVIERALAREPEGRFATAEEMAAALFAPAADPTVDLGPGSTMVLPLAPQGPSAAPAAGRRIPAIFRRAPAAWLIAAAVMVVVVLGLLARSDGPRVEAADPPVSTTAAPATTTPAQGLAASLRAFADGVGSAAGTRADDLATAMRRLADQVEAGAGGADATGLMVRVAQWLQAGQLEMGTAVAAIQLLRQVPGVGEVSIAPPTASAPQAPTAIPTAPNAPRSGSGSGEGDGGGDDGGDDKERDRGRGKGKDD